LETTGTQVAACYFAFFTFQIEIDFFLRREQREHGVDAFPPPVGYFIREPVATARPRRQRQAPWPRSIYPVELGPHGSHPAGALFRPEHHHQQLLRFGPFAHDLPASERIRDQINLHGSIMKFPCGRHIVVRQFPEFLRLDERLGEDAKVVCGRSVFEG
jgi:hypothetical protein